MEIVLFSMEIQHMDYILALFKDAHLTSEQSEFHK